MGQGKLKASALAAFLHENNRAVSITKALEIAKIYIQEAKAEGVNSDIASFRDLRLGIRAHIQHLKAYASRKKLHNKLVDPRFRFVKRGSIKNVNGLSGKWAADKRYGTKIRYLMDRMYREKG